MIVRVGTFCSVTVSANVLLHKEQCGSPHIRCKFTGFVIEFHCFAMDKY